jgi:tetratricopeptide (TPR) repeat protein
MLTFVLIAALAALVFAYLAAPLLFPQFADPLPERRDPVLQELEEERDALLRAIFELEQREDLAPERREQLRARYEAKAAKVLRSIDEYQATKGSKAEGVAESPKRWRFPYATLTLLAIVVTSGSILGGFVVPRVGQDATITTFDEGRLAAGRALLELQQAAQRNPNVSNLMALADAYWQLGEADEAFRAYERIAREFEPAPALAYRRLGFLALQDDLEQGLSYLEQARSVDPTDLDTLYALGEVYFALGRSEEAVDAWQSFLALERDPEVEARLALASEVGPLLQAVQEAPSRESYLALADAYWRLGEQERAADVYFRVLTSVDPQDPRALSRVGQFLFFRGRTADAIGVLERADAADPENRETLLFLGNAHFSEGDYAEAIEVWERYVALAGGPEEAGRVPGLIADARARLSGSEAPVEADTPALVVDGAAVYAQSCATCHGALGQGGSGPRLAGNARAQDAAFVRRITEHGRGMMPAFRFTLTGEQLEAVVTYVSERLAPGEVGSSAR